MSLVTEKIKASASEIYYGDEICQEKSKFLLQEVGLPRGLLPLKDIIECGYVKETGFVWLKQKKSITYKFESVGRVSNYATEVTAFVEDNKIKKLTGVKTKELLVWLTLSEITVDPPSGKITFKTPSGLFRSFPASAFEIEGEVKKEKKGDKEDQNEVKKDKAEDKEDQSEVVKEEKKDDKEDESEVKMEKKEDKEDHVKEAVAAATAAVEVVKVV